MFRDLKEYQEIQNLYANNVYFSEDEKKFIEVVKEAELTDEELEYISENTEEIISDLKESELLDEKIGSLFKLGGLVKGIKGAKNVSKLGNLGKMGGASKPLFKKGIISKLTKPLQRLKPGPMGKKLLGGFGVGAAIGTGIQAVNAIGKGMKAKSDAKQQAIADAAAKKKAKEDAISKQVDKYVEKRKSSEPINKVDPKQFDNRRPEPEVKKETEKEPEVKPQTEVDKIAATPRSEIKKSGRTAMIKKNIDRFGKDRVQMLQDKNKDFQAMKKGNMTKDQFIKKYPKSITAQRAKGLRDQTEWDAYDLVLEYLHSSGQVATIEEANYVMTEMDGKTIQDIVEEQKKNLDEKFNLNQVRIIPALVKGTAAVVGTKMIASKMGEKSVKPVTPPVVNTPTTDIKVGDGIEQRKKGESLMDYYKRRKNNLETQDKKLGAGEY